MSMRVGDAVFIRGGMPATVKERDPISGQLILEADAKKTQDSVRHGYLNGMEPETRGQLYDILDAVKANSEAPEKRVDDLRAKIADLDLDPRNYMLTHYLKAEMAHIMNTYNVKPKTYTINESKAR